MRLYDLVNHPVENFQAQAASSKSTTQTPSASGTFITPQSLVTFPFAAGVVTGFWKGAQALFPSVGPSPWTALVIALAVGLAIYLITISDERLALTRREKIVGAVVGFFNCFYLFISALGIGPK